MSSGCEFPHKITFKEIIDLNDISKTNNELIAPKENKSQHLDEQSILL